ncbi:MAG: hypothetical protein IMY75_00645 [Chloroflexi bacterium]|nr:hypothetical protein [Chloroflexota bacterium]
MRTLEDLKQELMENPEFAREYEALEPEQRIARRQIALRLAWALDARLEVGLVPDEAHSL